MLTFMRLSLYLAENLKGLLRPRSRRMRDVSCLRRDVISLVTTRDQHFDIKVRITSVILKDDFRFQIMIDLFTKPNIILSFVGHEYGHA